MRFRKILTAQPVMFRYETLIGLLRTQKLESDEIPAILNTLPVYQQNAAMMAMMHALGGGEVPRHLLPQEPKQETPKQEPPKQEVELSEVKRVIGYLHSEDRVLLERWRGSFPVPVEKKPATWLGRILLKLARLFG